ncbi:putative reverse transcriptase domain-containing protein [Tanacetum coccineum]
MPPRRRSQTNPQPPLTQEAVNQLVRDGIEAAIRAERERVREEATRAGGPAGGPVARECTFTGFMKCGPTQFYGTEGAVGLCRWFEKMESTFGISEYDERRKVKFATATLHGRALTWWNSQVATLGLEVANGKPWTEVKKMMIDKFCPIEEVQRLEDELRHLKLRDTNIAVYTERFNELALLPDSFNDVVSVDTTTIVKDAGKEKDDEGNDAAAAQNNVVDQGGLAPKCNRCGLCHFGNCPMKCTKCNKMGHKARDCKVRGVATRVNALPIRVCYECGERNHDQSRCPNLADLRRGNVTGQAYALRDAEQGQGPNVVTGTFLLSNRYARVLFDSGSDKSFINCRFSHLINIKPVRLNISYEVELVDGKLVSTNTILRGCTLNLLNQLFEVDLMSIELGTFDVIIGMDWLVKDDTLIVCGKKEVHIPVKGKMLVVKGNCAESRLKVVSCIKARKYIERGCHLFVAHVTEKEPKEKCLEDVPIIRDFPKVFPDDLPGLPPPRQVEFRIKLMPGATPVARTPYRLAPLKLKELSDQLKELSD